MSMIEFEEDMNPDKPHNGVCYQVVIQYFLHRETFSIPMNSRYLESTPIPTLEEAYRAAEEAAVKITEKFDFSILEENEEPGAADMLYRVIGEDNDMIASIGITKIDSRDQTIH